MDSKMKGEDIKFLAYKLLEWAGMCEDRKDFDSISDYDPLKKNAFSEAQSILSKLDKIRRDENVKEAINHSSPNRS